MKRLIALALLGLGAQAWGQGVIVFERGSNPGDLSPNIDLQTPSALFVIDPAVTGAEPVLVPGTRDGSANLMPSWFPDQRRLVFVSNRNSENRGQLWTVVASLSAAEAAYGGSTPTLLLGNEGNNLDPVVSPSGERIAFVSTIDLGGPPEEEEEEELPETRAAGHVFPHRLDVYVMDASGGGLRRLTNDDTEDRHPHFSGDGKTIYFVKEGLTPTLYRVPVDGGPEDAAPVLRGDGFPVTGRDLSVFPVVLGDLLYFNNLQGFYTAFDSFTRESTAGAGGLVRPYIGQDPSLVVHTTGGNLHVSAVDGSVTRTLLLTGDVGRARWFAPGETPLPESLELLRPNGGEVWPLGSTQTIEWAVPELEKADESIKIELSRRGIAPITLAASTENDGVFEWSIPEDLAKADNYVVTVSFVGDPKVHDSSDEPFTLVPQSECPAPGVPKGVVATDGSYRDKVLVLWEPVVGATEYIVFRNRIDSWSTAQPVATVTAPRYEDFDTIPMATQPGCRGSEDTATFYYYFVQARNDCGIGPLSASDEGYRGKDEKSTATGDALLLAAVALGLALWGRRRQAKSY